MNLLRLLIAWPLVLLACAVGCVAYAALWLFSLVTR
jgi:hypothetical protein